MYLTYWKDPRETLQTNTRKKIKNKINFYRQDALAGVLQSPKYGRSLHATTLLGSVGMREKESE